MQEFKLPDLGEGMQEAEIRRWLVKSGDTIKLDQPMLEVETDKAVVEIPSPITGRISTILVQEGTVAKLGEVLVTFDSGRTDDSGPSQDPNVYSRGGPHARPESHAHPTSAPSTSNTRAHPSVFPPTNGNAPTATMQRILAAPAVRKRAFELDIDLAQIPSSQPNGRVTMEDLKTYAENLKHTNGTSITTSAPEPDHTQVNNSAVSTSTPLAPSQATVAPTEERQVLTGLRKRIVERMERSWRIVPHATAFDELDGTELIALRQTLKSIAQQRGVHLTYIPLLVKLLLPVLKEFPIFNASFDEERREIIYKRIYHIGIAANSPEGLLVPVLRSADQLTILQITQHLEHLIEGAQKRTLSMQEVSGSTFTLNNVGSFGGSSGTPIINYPEVAILAVGRLQEKAVVHNGTIMARPMMPLALSFDHRLIDGALAGKFLARFKDLVEYPQQLLLDML